MQVTGDGDHAVITLRPDAIIGNMQENASAFEAWSLALHHWCGAHVSLFWQPPIHDPDPKVAVKNERHHQRFLYRVERFRSLFDWFTVAPTDPFKQSQTLDSKSLFLNVAGKRDKNEARQKAASPENELECRLRTDAEFHRHYDFGQTAIKDRQFPVGLFSAPAPSVESAVFPGGKGAIDLVCLDGSHLWLFELKAKKNIPIGTITELLFYSSVMRDAIVGKFQFARNAQSDAVLRPQMFAGVNKITGVMLGHDLHPLLADPGLLNLLNAAVQERWNSASGAPAVSFRAGQIVRDHPLEIVDRG
jgi:hypothetical protein